MRSHPPLSKPEDNTNPITQPTKTIPLSFSQPPREKGTGVRAWLLLDPTGQAQVVEAGKHSIMRRTGLPARDLRILDPLLSYPSTVLGRERAIVINLEHIKAIITAQEVLLLNSRDPSATPFVEELQRRLLCHFHATKLQKGNGDDSNWTNLSDLAAPHSRVASPENSAGGFPNYQNDKERGGKADGKYGFENRDGSKVLPFEFVAFEACLEAACSCLENDAKTLEQEAHPALDKLTSKISRRNLERVRQIKSRLVAITGRVQKVRDELEHLLDDDEDMAEMYLTEKLAQQHLENSSTSFLKERKDMDKNLQKDLDDRIPAGVLLETLGPYTSNEGNIDSDDNHVHCQVIAQNSFGRDSHGTHIGNTRNSISKHLNVEELEMLLEAYFVQVDGTLNKLSTLREYVNDTEDYINTMLDDKQNHLLQIGVVLTTATVVISFFSIVTGIFGMNIGLELFNEDPSTGNPKFWWTTAGCTAVTIFLYVIAIAWYKHKRLLE